MNKILAILFASVMFSSSLMANDIESALSQISTTEFGVEKSTMQFNTFEKEPLMEVGDVGKSLYYRPLNREWRYKRFEDSSLLKKEYSRENFDDSSWELILPVGEGEKPKSTLLSKLDRSLPIDGNFPKKNGVDIYRTTFVIPKTWDEREHFLSLKGISGAVAIYVNGVNVGYNENSSTQGVYDVTKSAVEGLNSLVIENYDYSISSFIESGDERKNLRFSEESHLFSRPKVRLMDYVVKTSLDPTYQNGLLQFGAVIKTHYLNSSEVRVFFDLYDPSGELVRSQSKFSELNMKDCDTVYFSVPITDPLKWSCENPALYSAKIRVQREMRFTEFAKFDIGFKDIEIIDGALILNGKKLVVKGVDYTQTSNLFDEEACRNELLELKARGFNTVRVKQPVDSKFYSLCDKLGLYIFNVAPINGVIAGNSYRYALGNNPIWNNMVVSRALSSYESCKNHPSVLFFTLGENSGNGYNMYEAYLALKAIDKDIPVAYPWANGEWNSDILMPRGEDTPNLGDYIAENSYPTLFYSLSKEQINEFDKTWEIIKDSYHLHGAFLGDWNSVKDNEKVLKAFEKISLSLDGNILKVTNNFSYTKLSQFKIESKLFIDGKVRATELLQLDGEPNETEEIALNFEKLKSEVRAYIKVIVSDKSGETVESKIINI